MAIGYLQHRGVVPNLQSSDWLSLSGQKREAFWTKVPNKNAIRPGARGRGRYLGDYKAMVVETSYVRSWNREWPWRPSFPPNEGSFDPSPAGVPTGVRRSSRTNKQKTGWDTESDAEHDESSSANTVPSKPTHLADLIEGFFDYYLGFPLEDKAVSIWAGRPLDRSTGYMPLAADEDGQVLPQLPKVTREEREELYEDELDDEEDEELFAPGQQDINAVQKEVEQAVSPSPSSLAPAQEAGGPDTTDDEAETNAQMAKIDALLKLHGLESLAPSFEEKHKQEKIDRAVAEQAVAAREASESSFPEFTPTAARFSKMSLNSPRRTSERSTGQRGSTTASNLLELHHANGQDHLFPFPDQEDPAAFVEPPHWTQRLVVQDPFIHTRNTCMNIIPRVVDRIITEMQRAHDLLKQSAPLEQICLNVGKDPEYAPYVAGLAGGMNPSRAARRLQQQQRDKERQKRQEERNRHREVRRAAFEERKAAGLEPERRAGEKEGKKLSKEEKRDIKNEKARMRKDKWAQKKQTRKAEKMAQRAEQKATAASAPKTAPAPAQQ